MNKKKRILMIIASQILLIFACKYLGVSGFVAGVVGGCILLIQIPFFRKFII